RLSSLSLHDALPISYNVTEDADLGIRLYKEGYHTAIVDSRTWEEANSQFNNWIRQRSRWIKGYMQTWLVHMRNPFKLWNEIGMRSEEHTSELQSREK